MMRKDFLERKGMDLVTNQSFINNHTTLSRDDQNKYDSIVEAVPKAKRYLILFMNYHREVLLLKVLFNHLKIYLPIGQKN